MIQGCLRRQGCGCGRGRGRVCVRVGGWVCGWGGGDAGGGGIVGKGRKGGQGCVAWRLACAGNATNVSKPLPARCQESKPSTWDDHVVEYEMSVSLCGQPP